MAAALPCNPAPHRPRATSRGEVPVSGRTAQPRQDSLLHLHPFESRCRRFHDDEHLPRWQQRRRVERPCDGHGAGQREGAPSAGSRERGKPRASRIGPSRRPRQSCRCFRHAHRRTPHASLTRRSLCGRRSYYGSYSSAEAIRDLSLAVPPTTRTFPEGSSVAVKLHRNSNIEPVAENVPVSGRTAQPTPSRRRYPDTSTFPDGSSVAVWLPERSPASVAEKVPMPGRRARRRQGPTPGNAPPPPDLS